MAKCPSCSEELIKKEGIKKLCAQIGNPEIAIYETKNPCFCGNCNEYYLSTEELISSLIQVKGCMSEEKKSITTGIYS